MTTAVASVERSRHHRRVALWLFLAFSLLYIGVTRGHFIATDEIAVYQAARSLWEEGNLSTGPILNTFPGRNGRYYAVYNAGQSVAALPLYELGKALGELFGRAGWGDWVATFAGPSIGSEPSRWGGDIEIFFVNLFNCFTTALLCALFFAFSLRLGASPKWALASAALLGLTSYVAPFSTGFYQHSSEALFLLWAFYFLFLDAQRPDWRSRALAGIMVALMLLFRFPSVVAVPGLGLYLLWSVWRRRPAAMEISKGLPSLLQATLAFAAPVFGGIALHVAINHVKFTTLTLTGGYSGASFTTPLLVGLYGYLLSPGESIFLFTPLLVLVPWAFCPFARHHRPEALLILLLAASYLVFYGTVDLWHGMWYFGPRYLVPIVPLLLLPFGSWMEDVGPRVWLAVAPLAVIGAWVQVLHVAVNFWYVALYERYLDFRPPFTFLFIPDFAPVAAHWRALLARDHRVDMWLVNVYRAFGPGRMLALALPLLVLFVVCLWKLREAVRAAEAASGPAIGSPCRPRRGPGDDDR